MMLEFVRPGGQNRKPAEQMAAYLEGALSSNQAALSQAASAKKPSPLGGPPGEASMISRMSRDWAPRSRRSAKGARRPATYVFSGPTGLPLCAKGLFRRSGEVHQWMYDRFSLVRAIPAPDFSMSAARRGRSAIAGSRVRAGDANGRARKPVSLYVEGRKP